MEPGAAMMMRSFSVEHRSHLPLPLLSAFVEAAICHVTLNGSPASLSSHTSLESSVSLAYCLFLKAFVWLLRAKRSEAERARKRALFHVVVE